MALGEIGPEAVEAVPALIDLLGDGDEDVRQSAAFALWQIRSGTMEAVPVLIEALADDSADIREAASYALSDITGEDFGEDAGAWRRWWEAQQ